MNLKPILLASALVICGLSAARAARFEFWPGTRYDPQIPSMEEVLGHPPGERITSIAEIHTYLDALAEAAPDRIERFDYARSWEGRELIYVVIGSAENIARLGRVREGMQALADPRVTSEAEAARLIEDLPSITWLAYGVHGNEISSPDAALMTAYHLLAARGDSVVDDILAHSLVVLDPSQNPDGRDRFVNHYRQEAGLEPSGSPWSAERDEPWPGGRTNHYLFDLNRDWFALTQPETRGRVKALQQWFPQVYVDLHEMGSDSSYYFAPSALPVNPHISPALKEQEALYGRNNAYWFDEFGFDYFTRETYDHFYPGYGDSWPTFHGSVGMTYEQASARGMVARTTDGRTFDFRDTVRNHFVASIATAQTTARNRRTFLDAFWQFRKGALEDGRSGDFRSLVIPADRDPSAVDEIAELLEAQGIETERNTLSTVACGGDLPPRSLAISLEQPSHRLIRTLLDRDVAIAGDFMEEQERRRERGQPHELYDITAFSLPLLFNLEVHACTQHPQGFSREIESTTPTAPPTPRVAYLAAWGSLSAARLLTAALAEGLPVVSTDEPFTLGARDFPSGTLVFKTHDLTEPQRDTLRRLARELDVELSATDTGYVDAGMSFGSNRASSLHRPRIAMAWDLPTSPYSAGNTRWVLEQRFGLPVTPIRTRQLASADLDRFDVLILPVGSGYEGFLGEGGTARIKTWVSDGGVLIAFGIAVDWLARDEVALSAIRRERRPDSDGPPDARMLRTEDEYREAITPDERLPDSMPGAILSATTDEQHWLSAGLPDTLALIVQGNRIYSPLTLDEGANVVRFAAPEELVESGYVWQENQEQLAFKPVVMTHSHGRGLVIAFTIDPTFRGLQRSADVLLVNAVVRGPAHSRRLR